MPAMDWPLALELELALRLRLPLTSVSVPVARGDEEDEEETCERGHTGTDRKETSIANMWEK
jgi:hypothetical protein